MGLFQRKRFVWNEPWFFQQRIRTKKAWGLFSLLLLVVAGGVGATLFFSAPAGKPIRLLEVIGLSLGLAAAVWWVLDGANTRRQAILLEDSIVVGGEMGKYSQSTTYRLPEIALAAIVMPEESKWPASALYFLYQGEEQVIGIDSKVSLMRLAQALCDAGVPVRLDGWQPNQAAGWEETFTWQADPKQVVERATLDLLPPGTTSMLTVGGIVLAFVRQSWAIVLGLLITGGAIYYGYQNWGDLGLVQMVLLFAVPLGALNIAAQITERFASASASQGLVRMARDQIRKRAGIQLNPDADVWIPVEIYVRDQFDKHVQKMRDLGFLQPDPRGRRMLFEGKKERWCIPAASIQSLALEEVQLGTPGQSALGALLYYVVVRFAGDEDREFGFRYARRDFGKVDDLKRAEGAVCVYEAFDSLLSRG